MTIRLDDDFGVVIVDEGKEEPLFGPYVPKPKKEKYRRYIVCVDGLPVFPSSSIQGERVTALLQQGIDPKRLWVIDTKTGGVIGFQKG